MYEYVASFFSLVYEYAQLTLVIFVAGCLQISLTVQCIFSLSCFVRHILRN